MRDRLASRQLALTDWCIAAQASCSGRDTGHRVVFSAFFAVLQVSETCLVALFRLGTKSTSLELTLSLQLGVVKAAGVAQSASTVGTTSPFGSVDSVAAVAAARWGSALEF